ncbi:MAG: DNRLRE domain-containing protein [Clostridia bacterium]|nr:DNRLRE domain-containing protein [Clostridia bacterium]
MKKLLCALISLSMLCSLPMLQLDASAYAFTDATFFSRFNYGSFAALSSVQSYVDSSNYSAAKQALLDYYKAKKASGALSGFAVTQEDANFGMAVLALDNIITGPYEFDVQIGAFTVSSTAAQYVTADITDKVKSEVDNGNISLMLLERQKQEYAVNVYSRESSYAPQLIVTTDDGVVTITADKDTYINSDATTTNYASAMVLPVNEQSNDTTDAFSSQTRRPYINFPLTAISGKNIISAQLKLYAYLDTGCTEAKDVHVLFCGDSTWNEASLTWAKINGSVYSWQSAATPPWTSPSGADGEYLNVTCRFWYARPMVWEYKKFLADPTGYPEGEAYGIKLLELMNAFATNMSAGYNRTLETGERLNRWVDVIYELVDSDIMTADIFCNLLNYMWGDCNYLNGLSITNGSVWWSNWRVVANAGFFKATEFLPEFSLYSTWRAKAESNLDWTFDNLYNSDYSFTEAGPAYAIWCTELYSDAAIMADMNQNPVNEEFLNKLKYTARYAMETMYPNGYDTNIGDSNYKDRMRVFTRLVNYFDNDEHLKAYTSGGTNGTPEYYSNYYTDANSAFFRNSYDPAKAVYLNFMNTTYDGHAHPDANQVVMYAYGKPLLVDSGRYGYSGSEIYSALRAAYAHNTIEVEGASLAAHSSSGAPLEYTVANDIFDYTSSTQSGYSSLGISHNRSVLFLRKGFAIISDTMNGASASQTYRQNWHFLPSAHASADIDTSSVSTAFANEANITVASTAQPSVKSGYHSSDYGLAAQSEYASFTVSGTNAKIDTILYPFDGAADKSVAAVDLASGDNTKSAVKFVVGGVESYYYSMHSDSANGVFGNYSFNGQTAYVSPEEIAAVGGSILSGQEGSLIESSTLVPSIGVSFSGTSVAISGDSLEPSTEQSAIKIYAPNAQSVTLNGVSVPFVRSGNYIYAAAVTSVTVNFVDTSGSQIAQSLTFTAKAGDTYSYTPEEYIEAEGTLYFYRALLSKSSTTVKSGTNTLTLVYATGDENILAAEDMSIRLDGATTDSTERIIVAGTNSYTRRNGFLKFNISALDTTTQIASAYVVLKTAAASNGQTTVSVYSTSSSWSESNVPAWASMPAAESLICTYTQPLDSVGTYRVIDITDYYDSLLGIEDSLSLQLLCDASSGSNNVLQYYSKEAADADAYAPTLIVTYSGGTRPQSVSSSISVTAARGASILASTGKDEGSGYVNRLMTDTRWNIRFGICGFDIDYNGTVPSSGSVTFYTGADNNATTALSFSLYPYDALGYTWTRDTISGVTSLPSGVEAIATQTIPSALSAGERQAVTFDITDYLLANPTQESFNFIIGINTASAYSIFYSESTQYAPTMNISTVSAQSPYISVSNGNVPYRYDEDSNGIFIFAKLLNASNVTVIDAGFEIWQTTDPSRQKKYERVSSVVPNSEGTFGVRLPSIVERRTILPYVTYTNSDSLQTTIYGAEIWVDP